MFPSTHWSLVNRVREKETAQSRQALDELIKRYRPAFLKYLQFVARIEPDRAEDILQGFLEEKIVRNQLITYADRRRGRFRAFLKTVLNNYLRSELRRMNAKKRTPDYALPASVLADGIPDPINSQRPDMFEIEWARTLLQQAIERFRSECVASNRDELWDILSSRVINPILCNTEPERYNDLISRMGFSSPSQVSNALATAKSGLCSHLKDLIGAYARDEVELEDEINDLFIILSRS